MSQAGRGFRFRPTPLFSTCGIGRWGSDHAWKATHGGGTVGKPPIPRTLTFGGLGRKNDCPPLIWDARDPTGDGTSKVTGG